MAVPLGDRRPMAGYDIQRIFTRTSMPDQPAAHDGASAADATPAVYVRYSLDRHQGVDTVKDLVGMVCGMRDVDVANRPAFVRHRPVER